MLNNVCNFHVQLLKLSENVQKAEAFNSLGVEKNLKIF